MGTTWENKCVWLTIPFPPTSTICVSLKFHSPHNYNGRGEEFHQATTLNHHSKWSLGGVGRREGKKKNKPEETFASL